MKLELDFTNKTITIVEGGSINEFLEKYYAMKELNLEDWKITSGVQYVPSYPYYPSYGTTVGSTECDCTENKCNAEYNMEEKYLGLNGKLINKEDIPFNDEIEEYETIENSYGDILVFRKGKYDYVTSDPTNYLSNKQIFTQWKKTIL